MTNLPREESREETNLLELLSILMPRWRTIVAVPFALAFVVGVVSFIVPKHFKARASFVPEPTLDAGSLPSGIAGLASQFGVSLPSLGSGDSPEFYADLLRSRTITDNILRAKFADPGTAAEADSAPLLDLLEVDGDSERERLELGAKALEDIVAIDVNRETGVVTVEVETKYATLSAAMCNYYLRQLNRFNLEQRQYRAGERRQFIEDRVAAANTELRNAEDDLRRFLETNRVIAGAPHLQFAYDRLQRQVRIKEEVATTLRRQYEEARIQEVNDARVLTEVDSAVVPARKSRPKRTLNVILAFAVGSVLGVLLALVPAFFQEAGRRNNDVHQRFMTRWADLRRDVAALARRRR